MQPPEDLVVVFETMDPSEAAVVKSLFASAGIPCVIRAEDSYDAFRGAFRGTFFSRRGRPVVFLVSADHAEDARLLLEETDPPQGG